MQNIIITINEDKQVTNVDTPDGMSTFEYTGILQFLINHANMKIQMPLVVQMSEDVIEAEVQKRLNEKLKGVLEECKNLPSDTTEEEHVTG